MTTKIKLVTGDNLPYVRLTLTNEDGTPIDLSAGTTTVNVYFREVGGSTTTTLSCTKLNGGSDGRVQFTFGSALTKAGRFEGEVEIDFNGQKQTVYEPLKFTVREQFA